MTHKEALYKYILRLADNSLIHGHRMAEWCSKGPLLEEDLAMTNMALDHIGRAQDLLKYAAEVEGRGRTEDDIAYKRPERQFYNNLLVELPRGDFATTVMKQLLLACFEWHLYQQLAQSCNDKTLKAIACKAYKEVKYHYEHARDWCYRLGNGTEYSHQKLQNACNELWMYTGELFEMYDEDAILAIEGIAVDLNIIKSKWYEKINPVLSASKISIPKVDYMQTGSRKGIHTEYLGHILSEMQYLQRAYPDAKW